MVTVVVKDDGKGFDLPVQKEGSFGLLGMREESSCLKEK